MLDLLTKKEINDFQFVIKQHKRKTLLKLCNGLLDGVEREELFERTFEKAYTSQKDYLLRNELRHLRVELRSFIATQSKRELQANHEVLAYLRELIRRSATALFEKEYARIYRKAKAEEQYALICELIPLRMDFAHAFTPRKTKFFQDLIKDQRALQEALKKSFYQSYRKADAEIAKLSRSYQAHDRGFEIHQPEPQVALDTAEAESKLSAYYFMKAATYRQTGQAKHDGLRAALSALEEVHESLLDHRQERGALRSNLGVELFLTRRFEEALPELEKALQDIGPRHAYYPVILFNYASALLKCNRFEEAWQVLSGNQRYWQRTPNVVFRVQCLTVASLLFLGRLKEARALIPESWTEGSKDDQCYLRLCLAILYYERKDRELAINELDNLRRVAREAPVLEYIIKSTTAFSRYLKLTEDNATGSSKLDEVKQAFDRYVHDPEGGDNSLPLLYISHRIMQNPGEAPTR